MKPANFPSLLAAFIESRRRRPFAWGSNDCVTQAADWYLKLRGRDPIEGLRGRWNDALGAARALAEVGGLEAAVDREVARLATPRLAERGDLVAIEIEGHLGLYVCNGASAFGPGEDEMLFCPMAAALIAWRT